MKKILYVLAAMLSALLMSGCYETKQEYVLNPDGSGKVTLQASFDLMGGLRDEVNDILEKSEGVDAWSDVSYKLLDDNRGYFKGTAYFRQLSDLNIKNLEYIEINWKKSANGSVTLTLTSEEKREKDEVAPKQLSDEEIKKQIVMTRTEYKQKVAPMFSMFLGNMKEEILFKLPGTIRSKTNLSNTKDGRIRFFIDGMEMLEATNKIMDDDEFLTQELKAGRDIEEIEMPPAFGNKFNKILFGKSGPIEAVVEGPLTPLFDYKSQMTKAKTGYPAMLKRLELGKSINDKFKGVQIGGIRLVRLSDQEQDVRPFGHDVGYTLYIIAELPAPAISVPQQKVTKVIADNGADLLTEDDSWDSSFLSKDKSTVCFPIDLILPPDDVKGIKEISGTLKYSSASASAKEVDLGISNFEAGSKGTKYSATIESIGKNHWGDYEMQLRLNLDYNTIKDVKVYDDRGRAIKFTDKLTGCSSWGDRTLCTYTLKTKFPAKGKIIAEVYEIQKRYNIPFKLENISLLGQPLK
ncbi:MAG: hypothetical protein D3919_09050 [Candidatus Electrothrix sp. AW5]|nr:hypothetical protein [Candidatus Electrothrix gigas]